MNKLHVYTGEGKGKTTAGMGLCLRSLGHGNTVLVAQFMKRANSGELIALRQFPRASVLTAPPINGFTFAMTEEEKARTAQEQSDFARLLLQKINEIRPQTILLDELSPALDAGMVDKELAQRLLDAALQYGETIATGRGAPDWLIEKADYVSLIQARKHPFQSEKLPARKGVEW